MLALLICVDGVGLECNDIKDILGRNIVNGGLTPPDREDNGMGDGEEMDECEVDDEGEVNEHSYEYISYTDE